MPAPEGYNGGDRGERALAAASSPEAASGGGGLRGRGGATAAPPALCTPCERKPRVRSAAPLPPRRPLLQEGGRSRWGRGRQAAATALGADADRPPPPPRPPRSCKSSPNRRSSETGPPGQASGDSGRAAGPPALPHTLPHPDSRAGPALPPEPWSLLRPPGPGLSSYCRPGCPTRRHRGHSSLQVALEGLGAVLGRCECDCCFTGSRQQAASRPPGRTHSPEGAVFATRACPPAGERPRSAFCRPALQTPHREDCTTSGRPAPGGGRGLRLGAN
ncbi:basic salivary proline-rich protein 4-like [Phyllostomus hastatus]|uniref:basic salivary proline-rich protein 4-like n=1 Tax=Phyllostomus hastatus TaxID=9423 RepID=UPI001E6812CF|nr:basic salivary proline-rich protein 4-like [Phyllostomus hastatus]